MIFTTFYFSGTGNTKWAVSEFNKIALEQEHKSCIISIEEKIDNLGELVKNSDMIGISFPIYAMNIPQIMKDFLHRLGKLVSEGSVQKPLFVITTVGYVDGCGPYEVVREINSKSFKLNGYISLKMSNNINTPTSKNLPLSEGEMNARLNKCKLKIENLIQSLGSGLKKIDLGGYIIVGAFRKKMINIVNDGYKQLSIDYATCTKCMKCVDNCPTKSIKFDNDRLIVNSSCTACMRCYNICPTCSIWHDGKYADPNEFKRYIGPK